MNANEREYISYVCIGEHAKRVYSHKLNSHKLKGKWKECEGLLKIVAEETRNDE